MPSALVVEAEGETCGQGRGRVRPSGARLFPRIPDSKVYPEAVSSRAYTAIMKCDSQDILASSIRLASTTLASIYAAEYPFTSLPSVFGC